MDPHRHFVFSIPKILRRYFLYDRKLLADLSRCAWESLKVFIQDAVPEDNPIPGAVIAIQTFGDFLGFNPHCHILVTDGCFYGSRGMFRVAPPLELKKLEAIFLMTFLKSPPMTITFIGTPNIPGMNTSTLKGTSSHNAF